eukprot:15119409-Ditylum_brightwellii.AAC.1
MPSPPLKEDNAVLSGAQLLEAKLWFLSLTQPHNAAENVTSLLKQTTHVLTCAVDLEGEMGRRLKVIR